MITVPTVFVLGAGASQPYEFPSGNDLRLHIFERYASVQGRANIVINTTPFGRAEIDRFIVALRFSGFRSVDAFLERRPEFMDIGKAMMGIELLHDEVHETLWRNDSNWLTHLFGAMVGNSLEEFADNKVSFITFNYDRTIEHFLFVSLKNAFGRSEDETAAVVRKIPIVHLHGKLGHLPWQNQKTMIEYGDNQIDARKMQIVTSQIKVVHEELTDGRDSDFAEAKDLLGKAIKVYLMGFGFGTRNVQRLGLSDLTPTLFIGTGFGMTQREISSCQVMCNNRLFLHAAPCLDFLRAYADLS